ncbi:MAG: DeoR/GlpR family DNA-binding transcription regulator [Candidatus Humimicrobiaceae bacterium]
MFQVTRKEEIIKILSKSRESKISDLCNTFNVSLATIHRDLNELAREGRIKKVHGGVLLNVYEEAENPFSSRIKINAELKKKVARKALEFVKNDDCLFMDNSTTCYYFAKELSESNFMNLIIITNSNPIPDLFLGKNNIQVISTGGLLNKEFNCFVGSTAIKAINEFNANKFFLSSAAISMDGEFADVFVPESDDVKRNMHRRSKESICILDSSKFNKIAPRANFKINEIDKIITDNGCSKIILEKFRKMGKELIIA